MRKEVLRMERVSYRENGIMMLEDFNLNILEGEIMGFLPINSFGRSCFLQLLTTNLPLEDGHIYYGEQLINSWKESRKNNNRITVIQDKSCLVEGMTVADNIFVLRKGFRKNLIQPNVLKRQLEPFLEDIDVQIEADAYVEKLAAFERIVVELLKGIVAGHHLIVLSEISTLVSGNELRKLHQIMRHYASQGYAFLYIGSHFEDILQICDRAALMSNGRIVKVLQPMEMKEENLLCAEEYDKMVRGYLRNKKDEMPLGDNIAEFYGEIPALRNAIDIEIRQGECVAVQCLDNHIYHDMLQILTGDQQEFPWNLYLNSRSVKIQGNRDVAVIQEECTRTMLFPELNYMDNLCFNLDKRMRNVWMTTNIRRSIRQEYGKMLGEDVFSTPVDELHERQKYQLVYSRILLQKPKVVFCIQPFKGADMQHRMLIWELLEQFLEKGIAVIILAVNLADTLSLADRLICLDKGKTQKEYMRNEFASIPIIAPWLYLYREEDAVIQNMGIKEE